MTKTVPAGLQARYDSGAHLLAFALKLTRTDGAVYGFTSADVDATIGGVPYVSAPGLDVLSWTTSAGLAVDNTEITVLADDAIITRADILAGRWNNAAFALVRYDPQDVAGGVEPIGAGFLGELRPRQGAYVAELRGLQQYLQQPVGSPSTKTCRYRLGSTAMPEGLCKVTLASYTVTGTLTGVTSNQVFTDSARAEAADYFGEGILTWTGGLNNGLRAKVKTHATGGVFTLSLPMIYTVQVGDTYSVHAGCRKRFDEDCVSKFSNGLNFGGEPHRPTLDSLTASPEVAV